MTNRFRFVNDESQKSNFCRELQHLLPNLVILKTSPRTPEANNCYQNIYNNYHPQIRNYHTAKLIAVIGFQNIFKFKRVDRQQILNMVPQPARLGKRHEHRSIIHKYIDSQGNQLAFK